MVVTRSFNISKIHCFRAQIELPGNIQSPEGSLANQGSILHLSGSIPLLSGKRLCYRTYPLLAARWPCFCVRKWCRGLCISVQKTSSLGEYTFQYLRTLCNI